MHCNLFKLTLFFSILLIFSQCGLPSASEIILEKPNLKVKLTADLTLSLIVTGEYPPDNLPNFLGINIYIGDVNTAKDIEKRILYISSPDMLPSQRVPASKNFSHSIVLSNDFSYRYTSLASDEDYSEANVADDRTKLLKKKIGSLETYFFRVKIVTEDNTSLSSDTVPIKIPKIFTVKDLDSTTPQSLSSISQIDSEFKNLIADFDSIQFTINNEIDFPNNSASSDTTLKIHTLPSKSTFSIYENDISIDFQGKLTHVGYSFFTTYPLKKGLNLSFILLENEISPDYFNKNLRLFVNSITGGSINFTLAYYEDSVTDIDGKEKIN